MSGHQVVPGKQTGQCHWINPWLGQDACVVKKCPFSSVCVCSITVRQENWHISLYRLYLDFYCSVFSPASTPTHFFHPHTHSSRSWGPLEVHSEAEARLINQLSSFAGTTCWRGAGVGESAWLPVAWKRGAAPEPTVELWRTTRNLVLSGSVVGICCGSADEGKGLATSVSRPRSITVKKVIPLLEEEVSWGSAVGWRVASASAYGRTTLLTAPPL